MNISEIKSVPLRRLALVVFALPILAMAVICFVSAEIVSVCVGWVRDVREVWRR